VNAKDINKAQHDLYSNPLVAMISTLPYLCRLVLVGLVLESKSTNTDSVSLRALWLRFDTMVTNFQPQNRFRQISFSDFKRVISGLRKMAIVNVARYSGPLPGTIGPPSMSNPDSEPALQKSTCVRTVKNLVTQKTTKYIAKDNGAQEDEEGSGFLISLNSLLENSDVKSALVEGANDRVAQRLL
jgi:hypothetical protein